MGTLAQDKREAKAQALDDIRQQLSLSTHNAYNGKPVVYALVTRVSRSGMQRRIRFFTVQDGELMGMTYRMSQVIGWSENDSGLKVDGCGMDMRFHTLDALAGALGIDGITSGNDFDIRSL